MSKPFASRRNNLCDLLRATASAFVQETSSGPHEDTTLRSEVDCLLALWSTGRLDPIVAFMSPPPELSPEQQIPYH